jgi:hypothetical protein
MQVKGLECATFNAYLVQPILTPACKKHALSLDVLHKEMSRCKFKIAMIIMTKFLSGKEIRISLRTMQYII